MGPSGVRSGYSGNNFFQADQGHPMRLERNEHGDWMFALEQLHSRLMINPGLIVRR